MVGLNYAITVWCSGSGYKLLYGTLGLGFGYLHIGTVF